LKTETDLHHPVIFKSPNSSIQEQLEAWDTAVNWVEGWINLEEAGNVFVFKALLELNRPVCKPGSFQRWPRSRSAQEPLEPVG